MILLISSYTLEDLTGAEFHLADGDPIPVDSFFMINERMSEFRCEHCNKLLGKPNDHGIMMGEIRCNRCKSINTA